MATPKTKKNPKRAAAPKKPARNDSMAAVIARYKARRAKRLDEAENPPAEGLTPEELVQLVRDRRDRRDAEGDPETTEAAMGTIAQQDEDLDTLLGVIDTLMAKEAFDTEGEENADEGEEENSDEDDPAATGEENQDEDGEENADEEENQDEGEEENSDEDEESCDEDDPPADPTEEPAVPPALDRKSVV